ncbi:hypothetical protein [Pantoea agglomerans]|uniref:hypothetical protein n=2 Tax=Enterobacter agglomerans TaxID=549 RepID=UPI0010C1EDFD|nr:hypothetical protein [Pantoea agglomerans]MBD8184378.1 hypothetical protein [Pantoea agglomerans]MBD8223149.1 hypothetical protein [Pantoea agglomerans]
MNDDTKFLFENAWKYFEIHTSQRMTVFNFYIAIIGLLGAASGICIQQGGDYKYLTSAIGLSISLISLIFYKLDERVSLLIKRSEKVLVKIEGELNKPSYFIFTHDLDDVTLNSSLLSPWTYGKCFRISFFLIFNIGVIIFISPVFNIR